MNIWRYKTKKVLLASFIIITIVITMVIFNITTVGTIGLHTITQWKSTTAKDRKMLLELHGFIGKPYYFIKHGYKNETNNTLLTIMTMCDLSRFYLAKQIAMNFYGPISIAVYFGTEVQSREKLEYIAKQLNSLNNAHDIMIGAIWPNKTSIEWKNLGFNETAIFTDKYPSNPSRNLAAFQVKTRYTLDFDVDFIYFSQSINSINDGNNKFLLQTKYDKMAWVIPSFEFTAKEYENDTGFLMEKPELMELITDNKSIPFHFKHWKPAQNCTLYNQWSESYQNYFIQHCNAWYEPWIIIKTEYAQNDKYKWNNEFVGRGANKVERITNLVDHCFKLQVIHDMFMVHVFDERHRDKPSTVYQKRNEDKYSEHLAYLCKNKRSCLNTC